LGLIWGGSSGGTFPGVFGVFAACCLGDWLSLLFGLGEFDILRVCVVRKIFFPYFKKN
jgi:hypothetical protein